MITEDRASILADRCCSRLHHSDTLSFGFEVYVFRFVAVNITFIVAEIKSLSNGFGLNWQPSCSKVSSHLQKMIFLLEIIFTHAFVVWHRICNLQWFEYALLFSDMEYDFPDLHWMLQYKSWKRLPSTVHSTEGKQPTEGCFLRKHFVWFWGIKELFVSKSKKACLPLASSDARHSKVTESGKFCGLSAYLQLSPWKWSDTLLDKDGRESN